MATSLGDVTRAVELATAGLAPDQLVLVACSGGADSLALAAGAAELVRRGHANTFGAIVIDHQLQPNSDQVATTAARQCRNLGLDPVEVVAVTVSRGPKTGGLEAAARDARRRALVAAASRHRAGAILLGHTRDDQAETVLLGLARGSGARSLGGMAAADGLWRRPMLHLARAAVRQACVEAALVPFDDPHNLDPAFTRVRVRATVLPLLEAELGPGVTRALVRTADILRTDADALDGWAAREFADRAVLTEDAVELDLNAADPDGTVFGRLPTAVRTRVERLALRHAGAPVGAVTHSHTLAVDALVAHWRGQGAARLPGDVEVSRESGKLHFRSAGPLDLTASPVLLSKEP